MLWMLGVKYVEKLLTLEERAQKHGGGMMLCSQALKRAIEGLIVVKCTSITTLLLLYRPSFIVTISMRVMMT